MVDTVQVAAVAHRQFVEIKSEHWRADVGG